MKRNYRDKQISEGEQASKSAEPQDAQATGLRCLRECVVPGHGLFKPGQIVTNPETVLYLTGNPNFEETKEVA